MAAISSSLRGGARASGGREREYSFDVPLFVMTKAFSDFATRIAHASGKPWAFLACVVFILLWALTGPIFGFSDTWQLIINTGTTIVTFLMVFLIQNTQNRDGAAIQTKLDELIRASAAQNRFIGIDRLTADEVEDLRKACEARARNEKVADLAQERVNRKAARAADRAVE